MLSPLTEKNKKSDCNYSKQLQYASDIGTNLTKSGENESTHPLRAVTAFPRWFPGLWFCDLMLHRYSTDVIFQTTTSEKPHQEIHLSCIVSSLLLSRSSGRGASTCTSSSTIFLRDPQVALLLLLPLQYFYGILRSRDPSTLNFRHSNPKLHSLRRRIRNAARVNFHPAGPDG